MTTSIDRRGFLTRALGTALVPASVSGLLAACTDTDPTGALVPRLGKVGRAGGWDGGYGALDNDTGILLLPPGFQMQVFGRAGDPMSDGLITPIAHDGMAAFPAPRHRVRLVRNHEDRNGPSGRPIGPRPYDRAAGAGTTTLEVGPDRRLERDWVSLSGTAVNCAGGPTPWGSWITCEETVVGPREGFEQTHGWCFEVPSSANGPVDAVPLTDMGRFSHEALSVDPRTGIVYETEDNSFPPGSGLFRFLPNRPGQLAAGGRLQMAKVQGMPQLDLRGSATQIPVGATFPIVWVDLDFVDPGDDGPESDRRAALFLNGFGKGGTFFDRLEGCWFGDGSLFFHDTRGGRAREGTVWQYTPAAREGQGGADDVGTLRLIFESPGSDVLDNPDNITVSPRGGLVLCEDGGGQQFIRGLTPDGRIFDFAANQFNDAEFAGACFSPDGLTLFVNIQGETRGIATDPGVKGSGMTLAIWGPWPNGAL